MIAKIQAGELGGTAYVLTLENGGLVVEFNDGYTTPAEVVAEAEAAVAGIIDGSHCGGDGVTRRRIGVCRAGLAPPDPCGRPHHKILRRYPENAIDVPIEFRGRFGSGVPVRMHAYVSQLYPYGISPIPHPNTMTRPHPISCPPGGPELNSLEMIDIVKRFPGVLAADHVDFDVHAGRGPCAVGRKWRRQVDADERSSTGSTRPDEGEIRLNGPPVEIDTPTDAIDLGIGMIHQHFMLVDTLTVTENVALGLPSSRGPLLDLDRVEGAHS